MLNLINVTDPESLTPFQNLTFTLDGPGPNKGRQDAPHPHQTVLDPTGKFILVPDLGADLVRVFAISDEDGLTVTAGEPLVAAAGSGPRHISFAEKKDGSFVMYLISELSNTITAYNVVYGEEEGEEGISFEEAFVIPTHGEGEEVPKTAGAAEILVSVSLEPSIPVLEFYFSFLTEYFAPNSPTANSSPSPPAWKTPSRSPTPPLPKTTKTPPQRSPPTPSSPSPSIPPLAP